jgi:hypothetical protein
MWRISVVLSVLVGVMVCSSICSAGPQVLEVSPTYMEFAAEAGGSNPAGQVLSISNTGHGPMDWSVAKNRSWVFVEPNSGTSMGEVDEVNITVDISGLSAGTYSCVLVVTADGAANSPTLVDVNLVVTEPPEIALSAAEFEFTAVYGGANPAVQILGISNSGAGTLNWEATEVCGWLTVEPNLGSSTGEVDNVNLSVYIAGLLPGVYDCNLTVSDPNASNSPQTVRVNLSITAEGLWVEPSSFDVNLIEGTVSRETLAISNYTAGDVNFIIRSRPVSGGGSAISANAGGEKWNGVSRVGAGHDFTLLTDKPYKPGELIVRFAAGANGEVHSTAQRNPILSSLGGGQVVKDFRLVPGLSLVRLPAGMSVQEALERFNKASGILYAEANYQVEALSTIPNDPRFSELWGMHNTGQSGGTVDADIDAPEAWDIGTGSNEVVVAVIDTGVDYTHPDLAGNMWTNEAELNGTPGLDDDGNGYIDDIYGYDFCNYDGNPMDDHYHGTHCAGTIGGIGDNSEGVAGVCWDVRIMALKFLDSGGSGWTSDAILCVDYSRIMGANLSSNSWGGGGYSQGLKDAIDAAGAAGMLFVAAAGNSNVNTDTSPHYPSSYDCASLISVMATNRTDAKSSFSNYGLISVDLGAPGSDILSCKPGSSYQYLSGTSMATPHVAGACALLWSMNLEMTNSEVKDILIRTVDATLPGLCVSGGRLNLYNAILETKAPWIEIDPEEGIVRSWETVDINVTFNAVWQSPGLYEAQIIVLPDDPCDSVTIPARMSVTADDLAVSPAEGFDANGIEGGPFEPNCVTYTLTNNGSGTVNWTTHETEQWLDMEPNAGILGAGESVDVNVCISAAANLLDPNIYTDILTFENVDSNSIKPRVITLMIKPPDCFTQSFDTGGLNLVKLMVTFSPDGSIGYYEACRDRVEAFAVDPNSGTYLSLGDDDFAEVILGGDANVSFYGISYDRLYIGSNGYITFGGGDTEPSGTLENHFRMPRVSGVFADLTPGANDVSYLQLEDRIVVTYEDVPVSGDPCATNSFQMEIFFADETVRVTWLKVSAQILVAGLSKGRGLPPVFFKESSLSGYQPCRPWADLTRDYYVNMNDLRVIALQWLEMDCNVPYWCGRTDLDLSGDVDGGDWPIFVDEWRTKYEWWLEPVAHWQFDEGSGSIAYDSIWTNHGKVLGATWSNGKIGGGLNFDGVNDYVDCGRSSSLGGMSALTIAGWFKPDFTISGGSNPDEINILEKFEVYRMYFSQASSRLYIFVWNNVGASAYVGSDSDTFVAGVWYHFAAVYDGASLKLYMDAVEQLDTASLSGNVASSTNFLGIGGPIDGHYFDGIIDDVRIYNRALSDEEIQVLYYGGPGTRAFKPEPRDGADMVNPNVILMWSPGAGADSHDVYLGTNEADVNNATTDSPLYKGNFDVNCFDPCGLNLLTTYYWRVDEVNEPNTIKGDVWSFTTWLEPGMVSWWEFDDGSGAIAHDSAGTNHGTVYGASWTNDGKIGRALDFDGSGDYVDCGTNRSLGGMSALTIAGWFKPDFTISGGSNPDEINILERFEVYRMYFSQASSRLYIFVWNNVGASAYVGSDSDTFVAGVWYHFAAVYDGANLKLYMDAVEQLDVSSLSGNVASSTNFLGIGGPIDGHYFDGIIDEVRIYNRALSDEEIQALYHSAISGKAYSPNPANGSTGVNPDTQLSWTSGWWADTHNVYFGTNYNDVNNATTDSPLYKGNYDVNSFDPCGLDFETTYFWRIDEVNDPNLWKGNVWSFTTWTPFDPNLNLVSWWKFDEGSGTIANDSAGNNDGSLVGDTSWTTGQIGGALSFDGNGDYVNCGSGGSLDITSTITVSAWVKRPDYNTAGTIAGKTNSNSVTAGYSLHSYIEGFEFQFYSGGWRRTTPRVPATAGQWHHIVGTYDGSYACLYIDGVQRASITYSGTIIPATGYPFQMGFWRSGYPNYYKGLIDDVRVYNLALNAEEVWQLYQSGL